jgi:hypothetical protein
VGHPARYPAAAAAVAAAVPAEAANTRAQIGEPQLTELL